MFKDLSHEDKKEAVRAMVKRMAEAYGVSKKDLPHVLKCSRNVMNNWIYYARIPLEQLDMCHHQTGVSMDWLLYGEQQGKYARPPVELLNGIIGDVFEHSVALELVSVHSAETLDHLSNKISKDIVSRFKLTPKADTEN